MNVDKKTLVVVGVIAAAGIFAATRSPDAAPPAPVAQQPTVQQQPAAATSALPPGHPPVGDMPAGHPQIPGAAPNAEKPQAAVTWTAPARWEAVPHMSAMRIATYRIPKVAGDVEDGELSITRAGGDVEQNALRWIGQFDEPSRAKATRSTKTINNMKVHFVDVDGAYTTMKGDLEQGFALAGAIVESPQGLHFFKLTGPTKTVKAARAELDALVATVKPRG
jgi:hypothetical protein